MPGQRPAPENRERPRLFTALLCVLKCIWDSHSHLGAQVIEYSRLQDGEMPGGGTRLFRGSSSARGPPGRCSDGPERACGLARRSGPLLRWHLIHDATRPASLPLPCLLCGPARPCLAPLPSHSDRSLGWWSCWVSGVFPVLLRGVFGPQKGSHPLPKAKGRPTGGSRPHSSSSPPCHPFPRPSPRPAPLPSRRLGPLPLDFAKLEKPAF